MLELMHRREHLLVQCDVQRTDLAVIARRSAGAIKVVDQAIGVVNFFRTHPMLLAVAVAALAVIQRRGLWGWARRGFLLWRAYRVFRGSGFTLKI